MGISVWQRRIHRAQHLANQHAAVAELLRFYSEIAQFQGELHQQLCNDGYGVLGTGDSSHTPSHVRVLVDQIPGFLSLISKRGPASLSQVANELQRQPPDSWSQLLDAVWLSSNSSPSEASEFLAAAFLQPYAEWQRSRAALNLRGYTYPLCPFCNRKPGLGVLRPQGDGASRSLVCGFCMAEWEFRRIVCPSCGEENERNLAVFGATDFEHIRVDCCETCKTYTKTIDLTRDGHAEPVVDEIAAAALDLWAQERGFSKVRPNLIGL